MFIASLFTTPKLWKKLRCPLLTNKLRKCSIYTVEFYSSKKETEILSFAGKWLELDNIILSEVSQI
jgi:hypothetical protein